MKSYPLIVAILLLAWACDLERIEPIGPNGGGNTGGNCTDAETTLLEASFGGGIHDSATAVVQTDKGEYYMTGFTRKQGERLLLYQTNVCEETLLYKAKGDNVDRFYGESITQDGAGGIVAAGRKERLFGGPEGYVQRVDAMGTVVDSWTGMIAEGLAFNDVIADGGSGYVFGGYSIGAGDFSPTQATAIFMDAGLTPTQEVVFSSMFSASMHSVLPVSGNRYVGVGSVWIGFGNRIGFYRFSAAGAKELQLTLTFNNIGGDNSVLSNAAAPTLDNNVIVAGHTRLLFPSGRNTFLMKLDRDGNLLWENEYSSVTTTIVGDNEPRAVLATADGGYLLVGTHRLRTENTDLFLLKVDANGNYLWDRSYGGSAAETATDVIETETGFVVVGSSKTGLDPGETCRVYWLKTDGLGLIE